MLRLASYMMDITDSKELTKMDYEAFKDEEKTIDIYYAFVTVIDLWVKPYLSLSDESHAEILTVKL